MTKVNIISIRQWELEVKTAKLLEAQENTSSKIAIGCSFATIGWESDASFVDQSQNRSKVNPNKSRITFETK